MDGTLEEISIEELRALVAAVEEGSLNAGARRLGVPKSTVSRRLARLEEQLGVRLLSRGPRGMTQTDAGRVVLEPAKAILESLASLVELARQGRAEPRGRLRVSAPRDLTGLPLWMELATRHPAVELELELTNRYVDVVTEGFDVALRAGRGDDASLIVRRVGGYRLRAVASPSWARSHGPLEVGASLREVDCVLLAPFRDSRRGGRRSSRTRPRHLVVNDVGTVLDGALRGLGVAVLPEQVCAEHLREGRLLTVHPDYDPFEVPLYAAYPDRRYITAALGAFLELASEQLGAPGADSP